MSRVAWLAALAMLLALGGCTPAPVVEQTSAPSYAELADRYNRRVAGLDRLWARAVVAARWRDEHDKPRYEQGNDSKLLVALPDRVALVMGSAGQIAFWAGSDADKYWLLKLINERHAFVGMHADAARALAEHDLPLQVSPGALPALLGLTPMPPQEDGSEGSAVRWVNGAWQVLLSDGRTRLLIDAVSLLPRQVELLGEDGRPVVASVLGEPAPVQTHGKPPGAWPVVMTRVEVRAVRQAFSLTLHLEDMIDAGGPNEQEKAAAFERSFDYQHLVDRAFKIPFEQRTAIE
jgi:hypothetical protein